MAIVAVTLFALLAMAAMTIDMGWLLGARRRVVRAADSAALGAAQSCAMGAGAADAVAHANALASLNLPNATLDPGYPIFDPSCDAPAGTVTVRYTSNQPLFFAPVAGMGETSPVGWHATAHWGVAGASEFVVPISFNASWLEGMCDIPDESEVGDTCAFLWDNDYIGEETWSRLALAPWDVPADHMCKDTDFDTNLQKKVLEEGGYWEPLYSNYPNGPTYACVHNGEADSVWNALAQRIGSTLIFPVNDPATQLPPISNDPNYVPDKYNIIGWASLELSEVYKVKPSPDTQGTCGPADLWIPMTAGTQIDLEAWGEQLGCYVGPLKSMSELGVKKAGGGGEYVAGTHFTFDPTTRILTWTDGNVNGVNLKFKWVKAGSATCGTQITTNSSGWCIVTTWVGYQVGGQPGGVNGGADFGLREVGLSA